MVLVTYKGKTKNLPDRYLEGLKGKERLAQIKSIFEGTSRPKTSFISKKSNWTETFNSVYGNEIEKMPDGRNLKNISKVRVSIRYSYLNLLIKSLDNAKRLNYNSNIQRQPS